MKLQKTFLAASLALVAASVSAQQAKPVQVTDGLVSGESIYQGPTHIGGTNQGYVQAPVYGVHATQDDQKYGAPHYANNYLPTIKDVNNSAGQWVGIDLGSNTVGSTTAGNAIKYDVFKYKGSNNETVFEFVNPTTGESSGYFVKSGNDLVAYTGKVDVKTLEKGGQIEGTTGATLNSGFENKVVNGEHVLYGYQGAKVNQTGGVDGTIVNPDGTEEKVKGNFGQTTAQATDVRYVQSGILANTGRGPQIDPSKNIYGVSARDNNNVTMMTGNGIALADLSNNGQLQTDGSVITNDKLIDSKVSGTQKSRQYDVGGKTVVEIYNNDKGNELESKFYEYSNGTLVEYKGDKPVAGTHTKTGTAEYNEGTWQTSKTHNTVTNQNVTYSESTYTTDKTVVNAGITTPGGSTTNVLSEFGGDKTKLQSQQSVSTGIIGQNEDKSNKYGLEVAKTNEKGETAKTTVTADGISTTGVINAADYQINGQSIVESIDTSVGKATAEIDKKIVEVDQRLQQFNSVASDLNNRIDDVEKTAYRGVAIALAAQQAIPNLGAGQTAVFGGAGVYKSEGAGALGIATVLPDGRTSFSGAFGVAGGGEVGGRIGVSYVFGGK
ncbi:YadA-like family protein [Acinetobacter larvae]|uniref:Trimeric autotransporter adhesin YadA-like C-terminal membrane anchor domain-containing protein n=1 Tax=Acinetobacter larvae TaxID=1789224 RepID=A0A1B2LY48_9GAMM|nr:YadA-like family protein [Acinetobacter larvae]AOA57882.1 hypothetical protein BFG52_05635 [Acinetobacter larvae]